MKTSSDPRHKKRVKLVQSLFAHSFQTDGDTAIQEIVEKLEAIDQMIREAAPEWPLPKINRIDLAILRQAVYELLYQQGTPPKVVIDESIEIAKSYSGESSPSFINGVLGTILKKL